MTDDGGYYVSSFVNELIPILEAAGFTEGSVIQPFSIGVQPLNMEVARKCMLYHKSKKNYQITNKNMNHHQGIDKIIEKGRDDTLFSSYTKKN